jgi:hypothetical protein
MIRTRLSFRVFGTTESEIRRRAVAQVNDFLELNDTDTSNNYDMEIDVAEVEDSNDTTYIGSVLVKTKH